MLERSPSKLTVPVRKNEHQEHQQTLMQEIMQAFDRLSDSRLIERISRPTNIKQRLELIDEFAKNLADLHQRLQHIRNEMADTNDVNYKDTTAKGRSVEMGSTSSRFGEWKKGIKTIEGRYYQVLIEGSFKHYSKISKMLGINRPLQIIDIEEWAHTCLRNKSKKECCD